MEGRLPTCYSPVRHSIHPPKRALIVRLACVKHAASVHPEPGSNSPLKVSQTEVCDSRRVGSGDPGSDDSGHRNEPDADPLFVTLVRTGRSPIMTGFEDSFSRILYWLVTVSSFQGSDAAGGYTTQSMSRCQCAFLGAFRSRILPSTGPGDEERLRAHGGVRAAT